MGWILCLLGTLSMSARHFVYRDLVESLYQTQFQGMGYRGGVTWSGRKQNLLGRERQSLEFHLAFPHLGWGGGFQGGETRWQFTQEHTRVAQSRQWSWTSQATWSRGVWDWTPIFTIQRYAGATRHPRNIGFSLQGKADGLWGVTPLRIRVRLYAQTLTQGGHLRWQLQPRWSSLQFVVRGTVERLRYPLTYTMESRETEELSGQIRGPTPGILPTWQLEIRTQHQRFTWNRAQNGLTWSAALRLARTWGPWEWQYLERRIWQNFEIYRDGRAATLHREAVLKFSTLRPEDARGWQGEVAVDLTRTQPPHPLSFNAHDRRTLRLELKNQRVLWGSLQLQLQGRARFIDEVFLHPMRSAYTRRDEEYRLTGQVTGRFWAHETTIAAWYSLFRFQPAQNLLIRYLEDQWTVFRKHWSINARVRLQENGQYAPSLEGPYVFYVQRKISEIQGQVEIDLWANGESKVLVILGRYDRWERRPGSHARTAQSETTLGIRYAGSLGEGRVLWHRRLRERNYLSANLSFHISF